MTKKQFFGLYPNPKITPVGIKNAQINPKIRLNLKFGVEENIQKIKVGYLLYNLRIMQRGTW